jgi:HSP20 family protein
MKSLDLWRDDRNQPGNMLRTFNSMLKEFDSFFEDFERAWRGSDTRSATSAVTAPSCDIEEDEKGYYLSFDLPGFKKEDLNVEFSGNTLSVAAKREHSNEEHRDKVHRSERRYGEFRRVFTLPENVMQDDIEANYENGVLYLMIPKKEAEKPRRIEIGESKKGFFKKLVGGEKSEEEKTHKAG